MAWRRQTTFINIDLPGISEKFLTVGCALSSSDEDDSRVCGRADGGLATTVTLGARWLNLTKAENDFTLSWTDLWPQLPKHPNMIFQV